MSEAQASTKAAAAETTTETSAQSLLDLAIGETEKQVGEHDRAKDMVKALVDQALLGTLTYSKNLTRSVNEAVKQIDAVLSKQLAAVLHAPAFQKLEGSWRGLHHLVHKSETSTTLKIRVLNVSKKDLFKDLDTAVEFDQSQMFKKMYEDEFGLPGGQPFGALIGDYEFTNHPDDIDLLSKAAGVAAAAFCPFISAAAPQLFGLNSFADLSKPRDLAKTFDSNEHIKWRSFRDSPDSRFVTLVMPRVLARLPYGASTKPVEAFNFEECPLDESGNAKPVPHDNYCWMNAAYSYGTVLTRAFAETQWCTRIRGKEGGGTIEGLDMHMFTSDAGDTKVKCPSEIAITDRRDAELSRLGFLPLCYYKNTDFGVFFGGQTTQKPKQYSSPRDNANSEISAHLPYIMATSRIAHYLKMIARDKVGSFAEASDCQDWLNNWIHQYVLADNKPSARAKAEYPLAQAQVTVKEVPGKPGVYNAQVLMRPWLQMEELNSALSMVAEIPAKA